jgi:hypothetical protein
VIKELKISLHFPLFTLHKILLFFEKLLSGYENSAQREGVKVPTDVSNGKQG